MLKIKGKEEKSEDYLEWMKLIKEEEQIIQIRSRRLR